jgi:hypothetical protein
LLEWKIGCHVRVRRNLDGNGVDWLTSCRHENDHIRLVGEAGERRSDQLAEVAIRQRTLRDQNDALCTVDVVPPLRQRDLTCRHGQSTNEMDDRRVSRVLEVLDAWCIVGESLDGDIDATDIDLTRTIKPGGRPHHQVDVWAFDAKFPAQSA